MTSKLLLESSLWKQLAAYSRRIAKARSLRALDRLDKEMGSWTAALTLRYPSDELLLINLLTLLENESSQMKRSLKMKGRQLAPDWALQLRLAVSRLNNEMAIITGLGARANEAPSPWAFFVDGFRRQTLAVTSSTEHLAKEVARAKLPGSHASVKAVQESRRALARAQELRELLKI